MQKRMLKIRGEVNSTAKRYCNNGFMDKKKILIISRSFYPINSPRSFRATELVKEFARQGHVVTLITPKNDEFHIPFEKEYGVTIKDLGPLRFPNIELKKGGRAQNLISTILRRGLKHFLEYPDVELVYRVKKALKKEVGYDLLISIAVPHPIHWGVAGAWRKENPIAKVWAADCGDPYMGFDIDRIPKPFYFKYVEKMFCRKADYITVPVEEAREAYYAEFRNKIEVIPQGFRFEDDIIEHNYRKLYQADGIPRFAYAGNLLGGGRNPHELLEFLVTQHRDFKFIIYTRKASPVLPYMDKADGRIEVREYIPRKELLNKLSDMDFLVNLENDTSSQAPSKLIDYYLTGRPVLSVSSSGLDTDIVSQFLEGNYSKQYQFKDMDRYRIENVCDQFLELCSKKEYELSK